MDNENAKLQSVLITDTLIKRRKFIGKNDRPEQRGWWRGLHSLISRAAFSANDSLFGKEPFRASGRDGLGPLTARIGEGYLRRIGACKIVAPFGNETNPKAAIERRKHLDKSVVTALFVGRYGIRFW